MGFKEYIYKDIDYDDNNDSCKITVEIIDDTMESVEHIFVLGSKHFKGKSLNTAARNNVIKALVKAEVKVIHGNMVAKAAREAVPKSNTKIPAFAKGTQLD